MQEAEKAAVLEDLRHLRKLRFEREAREEERARLEESLKIAEGILDEYVTAEQASIMYSRPPVELAYRSKGYRELRWRIDCEINRLRCEADVLRSKILQLYEDPE
jgi:hypothetical protein